MSPDLVSVLVALATVLTPPDPVVRTAGAVRSLTVGEAAAGRPVKLRGVVTFLPPPRSAFYLQDHSGAVLIGCPAVCKFEPGDRVEVVGVTTPGTFLPEVRASRLTMAGEVEAPRPVRFNLTNAESGYLDGRLVTVEAVVQRAWVHDRWLKLDLSRGPGDAVAMIARPDELGVAEGLAGAVVEVRGVCWANTDGRRVAGPPRLVVSSVKGFAVRHPPPDDPFARPRVQVGDLARFRPDPIGSRLPVRLSGVVTLNQRGRPVYVQDATGMILVRCLDATGAKPGDLVEAVGFPRPTTNPLRLENARLRVVGNAPLPAARPGGAADAAAGRLEGQVIRFAGTVHEVGRQGDWPTVTVVADGVAFTAVLLDPSAAEGVEPGSKVEVAGVVTRDPLDGFRPHAFAVMTRSGGLRVVEPAPRPAAPSWWTGRRVAYLSGAFLGVCLLGAAAVATLRAQVRRATTLVRKQYEEREKLEGQLKLAAKLEAVGRLAGGIAHDFNNLLTVILGCAQVLAEELDRDPRLAVLAADIRRAGGQAAALTGQLLTFSRQRVVAPHPIDLNAIVTETAAVLTRIMGEGQAVQVRTEPDLPPALADEGLVAQILLNLAVNAKDAMPGGGTFTLATSRAGPGWVRVTASDTGVGMSDEVKARIFEPFYTTKEAGKGTGLGLATVYGGVQTLGGRIHFDSELGRGTTFEVDLPTAAAHAAPPPLAPVRLASVAAPAAPESAPVVLLVEDDDGVRELARRVLEMAGLNVVTATGPDEALQFLADHGRAVDLMVTDVVMPEMGGRELAERARAMRPGTKVLFMSGYTADEVLRQGVREEQVDFLHKPFSPRELAERAWRLVREPAAPSGAG